MRLVLLLILIDFFVSFSGKILISCVSVPLERVSKMCFNHFQVQFTQVDVFRRTVLNA